MLSPVLEDSVGVPGLALEMECRPVGFEIVKEFVVACFQYLRDSQIDGVVVLVMHPQSNRANISYAFSIDN